MKFINLSLALTLLLLPVAPALADQAPESKQDLEPKHEDEININDFRILTTPDAEAPIVTAKPSQASSKKAKHNLLAAPMAFGGVLMGMTVGVPVRIARDISHETLRMRDQMTDDVSGGDKPDLFAKTVGSYTGMAYGVVSGVIKGSIKGTERAIDCGARKPFSKESLSLQDPN